MTAFDVRPLQAPPTGGLGGQFLQKWTALSQGFPEESLLFLDADTVVHNDVVDFIRSAGPEDFHARPEPACVPGPYPFQFAGRIVPRSFLHHELYTLLTAGLEGRDLPVFNTGVMVFKNGLHRRVAGRMDELMRLRSAFVRKRIPYPCLNPRLFDEIIGSLVLSRMEDLAWKAFSENVVPFYEEVRNGAAADCKVLHVWSKYYSDYLAEQEGRQASEAYQSIPKATSRRDWLFNAWLRAGVSSFRLPTSWGQRWARRSRGLLPSGGPSE